MTSNLKVILSAVGVAALLASPAFAKSHERHQRAAASILNVPADAQASVQAPTVEVYSARTRQPVHGPVNNNLNPDFQLGGEM